MSADTLNGRGGYDYVASALQPTTATLGVMLNRLRHVLLPMLLLAGLPAISASQQPGRDLAGPRVDATATALRTADARVLEMSSVLQQRRQSQNMGKPVALMVVGGAAVLLGALIGDDPGVIFMIGGAIALLYGLYLYLR